MQKQINGAILRRMMISGVKLLEINRPNIDALNVFPVPDGDTGTNMSLTMQSAVRELSTHTSNNMNNVAESIIKGALKGARGNSGVILSQILRGFCSVVKENEEIDAKIIAKAFKQGAEVAYDAVSKPKEGTILTVIRVLGEEASQIAKKAADLEEFFNQILEVGEVILAKTPDMLPVLKKAGVVDAGGRGLLDLFKGMYKGMIGEEIQGASDIEAPTKPAVEDEGHVDIIDLGDIEFGYCTEFFIIHLHKKTTHTDIDKLRDLLMEIGDSVIVIGDLEFVKVHVHTNKPGTAISYALKLGELDKLKIDNMLEQNRQLKAAYEAQKKEQGMLSICAGEGLSAIFKDLLVDKIIEGGQTMNPSANDIAEAARRVNANHVFVMPNNKNILLAAEQAKALLESKTLHVIPTKSIPQGISAVLNFSPDATVEENMVNMSLSLESVKSGQVTYAVRNSSADGFDVKKGDVIGLDEKNIISSGKVVKDVVLDLIKKLKKKNHEIITLYYGQDVKSEEAEVVMQNVIESYPDVEVDIHYGGQPIYYYIVSLE